LLPFAQPETSGGLQRLRRHGGEAAFDADHERRNRKQRERRERRPRPDAEHRQSEGEDRKAGDHARDADRAEPDRAQTRAAREQRPQRQRDGERREQRGDGEREMIADVNEQVFQGASRGVRRVDDEAPVMLARSEPRESAPEIRPADLPLDDPSLYDSRELSWLAFNDRVLEEALDERNPLLERLKFLAIFGNNLDEYFMIRVAALKQQVEAEVHKRSNDGRLPEEQLRAISARLRISLARQMVLLRDEIFPQLARAGVRVRAYAELDGAMRATLRRTYEERVFPVLTPLAVDHAHPFPSISNLSLSLGVELEEADAVPGVEPHAYFARVKVPQSLPRFLPIERGAERAAYVLLEDLIANNLGDLFPGMIVTAVHAFRVTRDADLDLQEDEAEDLLQAIESELRRRRFGEPVRLEVAVSMPQHLRTLMLDALNLAEPDLYEVDGPLAISDFHALAALDISELHDPPFTPSIPRRLVGTSDLFAAIRDGDILLHHPYESFDPVVQLVRQAADDPQVLAIKQTLYRTSGTSPVVAALIAAAENGKQVAAMIELKARFDEENNIYWARTLERAGAHVVYGQPELKTHAKVTLIVRDEAEGIRRYVHVGTGNYNEKSARVYTDFSLFSCRPELGADCSRLFNALTGVSRATRYAELLVAPITLRQGFLDLIERETAHARAGRPSGIRAKLNALCDGETVRALYRASQAGVPIDLLVRGMCELRPGIPGVSETIRVRSIVGRFLEHARAFVFTNGGSREVYMGSADWMSRNLDRRVETIVPIRDAAIAARICDEIIGMQLRDTAKTRILRADGTYERCVPADGVAPFDAQQTFLERAHTS